MAELISIIVPIYNEAANVEPVYTAIKKAFRSIPQNFEVIFIDDGSRDGSVKALQKVKKRNGAVAVHVIELAKNFGKEIALTAGLNAAKGDAAIMLDADLQHPPELIPVFIAKWEDGADIVIGVRMANRESSLHKLFSSMFYKLMEWISDTDIIPHATDYRLVDRIVIDEFNKFTEHNRITRGLFDWLGYKRDTVQFFAPPRERGTATYSYRKLIQLSVSSFVGHSMFPLKLAGYIGTIIVFISGAVGLFIFFERFVFDDPLHLQFTYPAILAVINLFLVGVILCCLGLISLYIANIHQEVVNRPLYVVRKKRRRNNISK